MAKKSTTNQPVRQTSLNDWSLQEYHERLRKFRKMIQMADATRKPLAAKDYQHIAQPSSIVERAFTYSLTPVLSEPEYDLLSVASLLDIEPIIKRVHGRIQSLFFKYGYTFLSKSFKQAPINLLKLIFMTMEAEGGINIQQLIAELGYDWIRYGNVFLEKVYSGKLGKGIINKKKIAYYKRLHPALIKPVTKEGKVVGWRYYHTIQAYKNAGSAGLSKVAGVKNKVPTYTDFTIPDIVHLHQIREAGFIFAEPRSQGIVDDVKALRHIEENVHMYLVKHIFPLVHVKIGTESRPAEMYPDGTSEVDYAWAQIQEMPSEGMIVTPERYEVQVLKTNSDIDALSFIEAWKARLYIDLGVSPIDMGEPATSNKATADRISENLKDTVKTEQAFFAMQFNAKVLRELLLDEGVNPIDVGAIEVFFKEIDLDTMLRHENHVINLFNNSLLTEDESRERIGLQRLSKRTRKKTKFEQQILPLALLKSFGTTDPDVDPVSPDPAVATLDAPVNQFAQDNNLDEIINDLENVSVKEIVRDHIRKKRQLDAKE